MLHCKTNLSRFADINVSYAIQTTTTTKWISTRPLLQKELSTLEMPLGMLVKILMLSESIMTSRISSTVRTKNINLIITLIARLTKNFYYPNKQAFLMKFILPVNKKNRKRLIRWQNPPNPCRYFHKLSNTPIDTFWSNELWNNNL